MPEIILVGEPMAMFIADYVGKLEDVEKFTRSLAGAEVNVCIGLKRLGYDVSYVTKLGVDPFGKYIKNFLDNEGIDTKYITFDSNYPTAFQMKSKVETGDPEVVYFRKGSAASHMSKEDIDRIDFESVRHVHVTGIPPALSLSCREATYRLIKKAREKGLFITFDPNLRPSLWPSKEEMVRVINDIASKCDMVLPGISEGVMLTGSENPNEIADFYLKLGVKIVIVKIGEKGAFVKTREESYTVPGFKVPMVVDTVGAGDGFAVGIISGLLEKLPLRDAVVRGNAIGSLQVMVPGDNEGLPDRAKLNQYLKEQARG
ncbi:sugar kinase [Fonticella tunisiensis]|uniref:2-dehydro-3-deoxygluconokinase n=1 Tax=Fonticella tunisiensis TaxID=1096341 RepID=A0A4R7KU63_9CLOT|nr:sugar kinase [Fonticella tunisiensis]TDT62881.1 2-dehydro-3-deoxygluconokinase [Fonticella tunisiensis]